MEFFRKIKFAVLVALIPAMLALTGNAIFNLHIHKQSNGSLFVHAHPFNTHNTNNGHSHSHTRNDCVSIHHLTSFLFVVISTFVLSQLFAKVFNRIQHKFVESNFGYTASPLNNRAPPTFS